MTSTEETSHVHGNNCGHTAIIHSGHKGYIAHGRLHCMPNKTTTHFDSNISSERVYHNIEQSIECKEGSGKLTQCHTHGEGCGHEAVVHGDHEDFLVAGVMHHPHGGHCDSYGEVKGDTGKIFKRRHELQLGAPEKVRFFKNFDNVRFMIMLVVIGSYFLVELIYGAIIDSLALVADAMHMLTDFIALIIGFYSSVKSKVARNSSATFGLTRMEVVGGFMNACFLLAISFNIFLEAITKIIKNEANETLETGALKLIIVAGVGLAINLGGLVLFSKGHGHGHGHGSNFNIRAVFLHVLGDSLGSVAALTSGCVIHFTELPKRTLADPICSLLISLLIFASAVPIVRGTLYVLLEKVPRSVDLEELEKQLKLVPGVLDVHELHVWQLNLAKIVGSCHVILAEHAATSFARVSQELKEIFHVFGVHSTSVQPEFHHAVARAGPGERCFDLVCEAEECVESACCRPQGAAEAFSRTG